MAARIVGLNSEAADEQPEVRAEVLPLHSELCSQIVADHNRFQESLVRGAVIKELVIVALAEHGLRVGEEDGAPNNSPCLRAIRERPKNSFFAF